MRNTNQKFKILEYLKSVKTHPTAQEVYEEVKKELPMITLATVYRNLNAMAERKEILRFEAGKEYRYDADTGKHQHFICRNCGKIYDLFNEKLSTEAIQKATEEGFKAEYADILIYGVCKDCVEKESDQNK